MCRKTMKKGIIQIFFSNIIFMIFGILNNFILPKYLPVDVYADFKTYILYTSYVGFMSLGFIHGMFLKYGGKTLNEARNEKCGSAIKTFCAFQMVLTGIVIVFGLSCRSTITVLFGLSIFSANVVNLYKNFSTATAEYKVFSISTSFEKTIIFVVNTILVFLFRCDNFVIYSLVIIAVLFIEIIYYRLVFENKSKGIHKGSIEISIAREIMALGIILLLGSGVSTLFTGIDQWFIKFLMDKPAFASYSFAVSMERIIALFITPITTVLYNYFCKEKAGEHNDYLKQTLLIWSFLILAITYPLKWVVQTFISNYNDSIAIISILFCGQALNCIINGIYVNKYKAEKKQNYFLKQMGLMTVLSIVLNGVMYSLFHSMIGIAFATLITKYIWLLWCELDSQYYKYSFWENVDIIILIVCLIICSKIGNSILGFFIYILIWMALVWITMKDTSLRLLKDVKGQIKKYRKDFKYE